MTNINYDFLIIGSSGMQGQIVSRDLLERGYKVLLSDLYKEGSEKMIERFPGTTFAHVDLRKYSETLALINKAKAPIVINCAEGDWNIDVYNACLKSGKHIIDLGSDIPMTKEQLVLAPDFEKVGLTAITGCGSTPGINNVMLNYASEEFDSIDTIEAGFAWDSNIKKFVVPFSIESILEEFTEPAPVIDKGVWVDKIPLENIEEREFREIGKQKCFPVRHPETYTFYKRYKKEGLKNMRFYAGFPEHSMNVILKLIELSLGSKEPIQFEEMEIRPVDALSRILQRLEKPKGYTEKENLWVNIFGKGKGGENKRVSMECLVPTFPEWEDAGCNIDTGMPASIIAQMIKDGRISKRGSFSPGEAIPAVEFFKELRQRGMVIYKDGVAIN